MPAHDWSVSERLLATRLLANTLGIGFARRAAIISLRNTPIMGSNGNFGLNMSEYAADGPPLRDEGVIKFNCDWQLGPPPTEDCVHDLIAWRERLFQLGLIGVYPDGVGYGNLSMRVAQTDSFIVSGSQTGHLPHVDASHFTRVSHADIAANRLQCVGPMLASSESLTHAAIYAARGNIMAIIHVHHPALWRQLKYKAPTTDPHVPYGTPATAAEIERLFAVANLDQAGILVMAGHEDGIISVGRHLDVAGSILLRHLALLQNTKN